MLCCAGSDDWPGRGRWPAIVADPPGRNRRARQVAVHTAALYHPRCGSDVLVTRARYGAAWAACRGVAVTAPVLGSRRRRQRAARAEFVCPPCTELTMIKKLLRFPFLSMCQIDRMGIQVAGVVGVLWTKLWKSAPAERTTLSEGTMGPKALLLEGLRRSRACGPACGENPRLRPESRVTNARRRPTWRTTRRRCKDPTDSALTAIQEVSEHIRPTIAERPLAAAPVVRSPSGSHAMRLAALDGRRARPPDKDLFDGAARTR